MRANLLAALIGVLCVAGCGGGDSLAGGGGGGGSSGGGGTTTNVQTIVVDSGPTAVANSNRPAINTAYTTVTICVPGSTTNCQTIDHIQVDTGSSGLRILSEVLTLTLPLQMDSTGKNAIAECTSFVDGSSWGPIRNADVKIAGETAANQELQIIGDTTYTVPSTCTGTSSSSGSGLEDTVANFGANGILGVAPYVADCGDGCDSAPNGTYFTCPTTTTCADSGVLPALQVKNPVAAFANDNNGIIITLPQVATAGVASVSGSLTFGIGTQSNNAIPTSATVFVPNNMGFIQTAYKLATLNYAFIDSGSNGIYFHDTSVRACTTNVGFYCPQPDQTFMANLVNPANGTTKNASFTLTDLDTVFANSKTVIGAMAGFGGDSSSFGDGTNNTINGNLAFDWGLPFHYGKSVYVAIEGKATSAATGPYFAF